MDAETVVRPVVETAGLELVDVAFDRHGGRRVLRVIVDRDGGIDLDAIAMLSERLSRRLDLESFSAEPYSLEVSSPGIERTLRSASQFRRAVGERIRVRVVAAIEGVRSFEGVLVAADDGGITIRVDGDDLRLANADVDSARTVVDWNPELRRSNA